MGSEMCIRDRDMDGELLTPIRSMLEILEGFKEQPRTLAGMKELTVPNEE